MRATIIHLFAILSATLGLFYQRLSAAEVDRSSATGRSGVEIFESCRLCHSTKEMQRGPILDGLPAWYLTRQLNKFREGVRGTNSENRSEVLMGAAMSSLQGEAEQARVVEYIASLPPQNHLRTLKTGAAQGRLLYLSCGACHGTRAEGRPELQSPPLNVQEDWYLLEQTGKFKTGLRGLHPHDQEGGLMHRVVANMEPTQIRDVIFYIATELTRTNTAANKTSPTLSN